jgi:biotin synthase-like enzyme
MIFGELEHLYHQPLFDLISQSRAIHLQHWRVDIFELVRLVAVTRIALPKARVRLAAGRTRISREGQALSFLAGTNSIFYGDKLLTAKNPAADLDVGLLRELGLHVESMTNERMRNDEGMTKFRMTKRTFSLRHLSIRASLSFDIRAWSFFVTGS